MRNGAIDERRGIPIYKTNPSIPQPGEITRSKRNQIGPEHKGFVINASGEVLGNGVALAYEWEEVDDERFVKLFLAGLKQATGLSKPGLAVFELVYNELRNSPKQDTVQLSVLTAGLKKTTFYEGLRDLLKREFLFRSPYEGTFFINIRYMFNGDRLAFVKAYSRNGATPADIVNHDSPTEQA
jgi:hypothetical protein